MESIVRKINYTETGPIYHHYDFDEEDEKVHGQIYLSKDVWPTRPAAYMTVIILLEED